MNKIDQAILNALMVNMGYKDGEKVAIVRQQWNPAFDERYRDKFLRSEELCRRMYEVFKAPEWRSSC